MMNWYIYLCWVGMIMNVWTHTDGTRTFETAVISGMFWMSTGIFYYMVTNNNKRDKE